MLTLMFVSCSTDEKSIGGYVVGNKVTLNASLPNSGTRMNEVASNTYGLITTWSSDDSLDVLVSTNTFVSMARIDGNTFTSNTNDSAVVASCSYCFLI